jgi:hypothetical protein
MARASSQVAQLEFIGPPHRVVSFVALPEGKDYEFVPDKRLSGFLKDVRRPFRIGRRAAGNLRQIKLRLDRATPPGRYDAALSAGSKKIGIAVTVSENRRVTVSPKLLRFTATLGGTDQIRAALTNLGNVPFAVPQAVPIGLFDDDGVETALASTYRKDPENIDEFLSSFVAQLREGHAGLMKLKFAEGSGDLAPATSRAVVLEATLPETAKPGHRYHGAWNTDFTSVAIAVTVVK